MSEGSQPPDKPDSEPSVEPESTEGQEKATPTLADEYKKRLLNVSWIAISVIVGGVLLFLVNAAIKVHTLYSIVSDPSHHYAQEVADEYYIQLLETDNSQSAIDLRKDLIALAERALIVHCEMEPAILGRKQWDDDSQDTGKKRSTEIGAGFSPDHVIYCRSSSEKGTWVVGLDLQSGQGDPLQLLGRFNEVLSRVRDLADADIDPELARLLEILLDNAEKDGSVQFFDSVTYKDLYRHPILPK